MKKLTQKFVKRSVIALLLCLVLLFGFLGLGQVFRSAAALDDEGTTQKALATNRERLTNTKAYELADNTGYNIDGVTPTSNHPLGRNYADIYLQVKGGEVVNANMSKGGYPVYGYSMDEVFSPTDRPEVSLALKYNFSTAKDIASVIGQSGKKWSISDDTWKNAINGISGAGEVRSGALLVQKSATGKAGDWTWDNPYSNFGTESFHSTDFVNNYKPEEYDGKEHLGIKRSRKVVDKVVNGVTEYKKNDDGSYVYEDYYVNIDGYLPIYTPLGQDLNQGYFYRVIFAYELVYETEEEKFEFWAWNMDGFFTNKVTVQHYTNVVEETVLYICNGSGRILIQNLDFRSSIENEENYTGKSQEEINALKEFEAEKSKTIRDFGLVQDGHAVNEGFRVNFNGNTSYKVRYCKNRPDGVDYKNALNNEVSDPVYDGRVFLEPGKYEFYVTTLINTTKKTTIYINERGLKQNSKYYFGDGLTTSDSQRIFDVLETVPVYKAGATFWSVNSVDAFRMPIAGRIGYYLETLSTKAFEEKYGKANDTVFTFSARIEVNESYIRLYDDKGKPADGYSESKDKNGKTVRTISGLDIYKIVASKLDDSRAPFGGEISKTGDYVAEFANNKDYFTNTASGDVMYFTFRFKVVNEDSKPFINKNLFETNISFSDYESRYYGVEIPTNTTKVIYAFFDRLSAENFAYEYYRSFVKNNGEKYIFQNIEYTSYNALMEELVNFSRGKVLVKYFDASSKDTYLTLQSAVYCKVDQNSGLAELQIKKPVYNDKNEITGYEFVGELKLDKDIIVFSDGSEPVNNAVGLPFLNDRPYSIVDNNGNIINNANPVKFISVADYESYSIRLILMDGDKETNTYYNIPINAEVQIYLAGKKAESGKYKIVETNRFGVETFYYGIYIAKGDNKTELSIIRKNGVNSLDQTITNAHMGASFTVNSLVIKSATNQLDPYGILKISNTAGYKVIYQLNEIENIVLSTRGVFKIELIDRLGNAYSFSVTIYTPQEVHTLTFINEGEEYAKLLVADGERVYLDEYILISEGDLEFIGWEDENGNVYTNHFIFTYGKDTTLTAVWRYVKTVIFVYDGGLIDSPYEVKPGEIFRRNSLSKVGYEFYGYMYIEDGWAVYFIGQLNSVPNVQNLRLDAVWMDKSESIIASFGETLLPKEKAGMIFYGFATENRRDALIFTNGIVDIDTGKPLTLYALYLTEETAIQTHGFGAGFLNFINNIPKSGLYIGFIFIVLLLVIASKAKQSRRKALFGTNYKFGFDSSLSLRLTRKNSAFNKKSANLVANKFPYRGVSVFGGRGGLVKVKDSRKSETSNSSVIRRKPLWRFLTPSVGLLLVVVFAFTFSYHTIFYGKQTIEFNAKAAQTEREIAEYNEQLRALKQAEKAEKEARDNYITKASAFYAASQNDAEISDKDAFLYSLVFLDLVSFGYDVFPAIAYLETEEGREPISKGFGYTNYSEIYTDALEETVYFGCGFVGLLGEKSLTDEDIKLGVTLEIISEDGTVETDTDAEVGFIVSFEERYEAHYAAYDEYVHYEIKNFYLAKHTLEDNYSDADGFITAVIGFEHNLTNSSGKLEYLYSYDLGRVIYDPDLGKQFNKVAFSTLNGIDYEYSKELYNELIKNQNENYAAVETLTIVTFSVEAILEAAARNQPEKHLGIDARELYFIESQISTAHYYYINGETGEVEILEVPPDPPPDMTWFSWLALALQVVAGVVAIVFSFGAAAPMVVFSLINAALMFAGSIASLIALTADDPVLAANATAFGGGVGAIGSGSQAMLVGGRIFLMGGNKVVGGLIVVIGAIACAFGTNEVVSSITGYNTLKAWMGEDLYNGLYMGSVVAATIASILGSIYLKGLAKNARLITNSDGIQNTTKVVGGGHGQNATHKSGIDSYIDELAESGKYKQIYGDRALSTAGLNGRQRPDILAQRMDDMWELFEFASPSQSGGQNLADLQSKINLMRKNNPGKFIEGIQDLFKWGQYP